MFLLLAACTSVVTLPSPGCTPLSEVSLDESTPEGPSGADVLATYATHRLTFAELPDLEPLQLVVPEDQVTVVVDSDPACSSSLIAYGAEVQAGDVAMPVTSLHHQFANDRTGALVRDFDASPGLLATLLDEARDAGAPEDVEVDRVQASLEVGASPRAEFLPTLTVDGERWYASPPVVWTTVGVWEP